MAITTPRVRAWLDEYSDGTAPVSRAILPAGSGALQDVNTCPSTTAPPGSGRDYAVQMVRSRSERLNGGTNANWNPPAEFTFAIQVNVSTSPCYIINKTSKYTLFWELAGTNFYWRVYHDGGGAGYTQVSRSAAGGAWRKIICWYNGANIGLNVDGSATTSALGGNPISNSNPFSIGYDGSTYSDLSASSLMHWWEDIGATQRSDLIATANWESLLGSPKKSSTRIGIGIGI